MKKNASFFGKTNKKLSAGVLCIAAAVLLFSLPGAVLHGIIKIAGALIIAVAAVRFIRLTARKNGEPLPFTMLLNTVLLFALGMVLLCTPGGALRFIFSAVGFYLIITAVLEGAKLLVTSKAQRGVSWWVEAVFTAAVLILGVWLMLSPGGAGRLTEIVAGISLAVKGVELIIGSIRCGEPAIKKRKKAESGDIEADFVDKSDEL